MDSKEGILMAASMKPEVHIKKREPPESLPTAISFDLGGSRASHEDVYYKLKDLLLSRGDFKIISLQYVATRFRWVVVLDSRSARDQIAGTRLEINGRQVLLRRYDDIVSFEYKKYLRANGFIVVQSFT